MKQSLSAVVRGAGYHDVCNFMTVYSQAEKEVMHYEKEMEIYRNHGGENEPERGSLEKTLRRLKEESRQRSTGNKKLEKHTRGAR